MLMLFATNWDSQDLVNFHCVATTQFLPHALFLKVLSLIVAHGMVKEVALYI